MESELVLELSNTLLPATIDLPLQTPADAWFALAAIITLWAYVVFAPGRGEQES